MLPQKTIIFPYSIKNKCSDITAVLDRGFLLTRTHTTQLLYFSHFLISMLCLLFKGRGE